MNAEPLGFTWEEWGEAAFARARAEKKPVLLHIGATWCHWCHVMDEGSYTWPGVGKLINDHFVAVRVDTDHRPDINERYNQGGWPTFAVLDADGEVLMGRTYVPGHELCALLAGLAESDARWSVAPSRPAVLTGDPTTVDAVLAEVKKGYDSYNGGFGDFEKFPHVAVCAWLLDRHVRGQDDGPMLARTLESMCTRGMYDHEEGGFFRYTTQDDWTVPHYEKLLEDNARLILLYTRAAVVFDQPGWRGAAEGAVAWALRVLWDPATSSFRGSQDADEAYYGQSLILRENPPPVDPTVYAGGNGLMATALVQAGLAWDRPGLIGIALRVVRSLRARIEPDGRVLRTPTVGGLLEDQVQVAEALLAVGDATGEAEWGDLAVTVLAWAAEHLAAAEGGFYDRVPEGIGRLAIPRRPLPANAALAEVALRLAARHPDGPWRDVAARATAAALQEGVEWGFMGAAAAAAQERLTCGPLSVRIHENAALETSCRAWPDPDWIVVADRGAEVPPGSALVCSATACGRPATSLADVRRSAAMLRAR